jgi:hypothetical protein
MESICYIPGGICLASAVVNIAMAFIVMAPFAATRLLVLRMRERAVGTLQIA